MQIEPRIIPSVVILGNGGVQKKLSEHLARLFIRLPNDPELDQTGAIFRLLLTSSHLLMRFEEYSRYPNALWLLTKEWNPCDYVRAVWSFLDCDELELDAGPWVIANGIGIAEAAFSRIRSR